MQDGRDRRSIDAIPDASTLDEGPVGQTADSVRKEAPVVVEQHIALVVNGQPREGDVEPRRMLVQFLREDLELTGTHVGCDTSQCGACTVTVDGKAVKSCTMLAVQADGAEVKTIEGMVDGANLHPLQQAFWDQHGLQCGFCTPGMIMQSAWLLEQNPSPSEAEIREGISGNLCRCTGYVNIVKAIQQAAGELQASESAPVVAAATTDAS